MGKQRRKLPSLSDQIRIALANCGETRYRVAKETGMTESQLCRFAAGAGLSLNALDELADYLGLEVVVHGKGDE